MKGQYDEKNHRIIVLILIASKQNICSLVRITLNFDQRSFQGEMSLNFTNEYFDILLRANYPHLLNYQQLNINFFDSFVNSQNMNIETEILD